MTQNFGAITGNPLATQIGAAQSNVIWVDGMEGALNYPKGPNETLYLTDKTQDVIWMRETDQSGNIKNPIKKLSYTVEEVPFGPEANFVTKEEHQKLYELVDLIGQRVEKIYQSLN